MMSFYFSTYLHVKPINSHLFKVHYNLVPLKNVLAI
jgi:hypothetical protein